MFKVFQRLNSKFFKKTAYIFLVASIGISWFLLPNSKIFAKPKFPKIDNYVVDEARVFSSRDKSSLINYLAKLDPKIVQLRVVSLASLEGYDISDYGYQLGRAWGIGLKDRNNGVLIIVAPNERKTRIEVGYGLEGTLTDALSKYIIESKILPEFRHNRYGLGVKNGVQAIIDTITNKENSQAFKEYKKSKETFSSSWIKFFIYLILIIFYLMMQLLRKPRFGHSDYYPKGRGGFWGGGFGGGGFGGGGFGGGGGSFGGGGASGSW